MTVLVCFFLHSGVSWFSVSLLRWRLHWPNQSQEGGVCTVNSALTCTCTCILTPLLPHSIIPSLHTCISHMYMYMYTCTSIYMYMYMYIVHDLQMNSIILQFLSLSSPYSTSFSIPFPPCFLLSSRPPFLPPHVSGWVCVEKVNHLLFSAGCG